ncbi:hypothetical protein O3P69_010112 [Scylla paramamosain]|uniref:Uncharacterized protein n=1 Tax=Scylla paramamosain TaxID=85552 RepID=A0AAW0S965_SCYPA
MFVEKPVKEKEPALEGDTLCSSHISGNTCGTADMLCSAAAAWCFQAPPTGVTSAARMVLKVATVFMRRLPSATSISLFYTIFTKSRTQHTIIRSHPNSASWQLAVDYHNSSSAHANHHHAGRSSSHSADPLPSCITLRSSPAWMKGKSNDSIKRSAALYELHRNRQPLPTTWAPPPTPPSPKKPPSSQFPNVRLRTCACVRLTVVKVARETLLAD